MQYFEFSWILRFCACFSGQVELLFSQRALEMEKNWLLKSSGFPVSFQGISRLRSAFIFLRWFKVAYICIQVTAPHMWDKQSIYGKTFDRKLILRNTTHCQCLNLIQIHSVVICCVCARAQRGVAPFHSLKSFVLARLTACFPLPGATGLLLLNEAFRLIDWLIHLFHCKRT